MVKGLFQRSSKAELAAQELYRTIVAQAREPAFYRHLGVPDTLDGRFELIVLHVGLVVTRLRHGGPGAEQLAQFLYDVFFRDMDINLREMGVGDMGVARRIKAMAQAFYGRVRAYEETAAPAQDGLEQALRRNLLGTVEAEAWQLRAIADYVRQIMTELGETDLETLARGHMTFPRPPATTDRRGADPGAP